MKTVPLTNESQNYRSINSLANGERTASQAGLRNMPESAIAMEWFDLAAHTEQCQKSSPLLESKSNRPQVCKVFRLARMMISDTI